MRAVDQHGRVLGPKARQTRQRLLDATADLLARRGLRELRVVDVARRIGSSPATFYQYFKDVEDAVVCLAERAGADMPAIVALVERPWTDDDALPRARAIVDAFIRHWDAHHAVLRVRNHASDEGDVRFQRVRGDTFMPLIEALAARLAAGLAAGRVHRDVHPHAAAAALGAILERLAAYHRELETFGVTRAQLVDTCARILVQTLVGRAVD